MAILLTIIVFLVLIGLVGAVLIFNLERDEMPYILGKEMR